MDRECNPLQRTLIFNTVQALCRAGCIVFCCRRLASRVFTCLLLCCTVLSYVMYQVPSAYMNIGYNMGWCAWVEAFIAHYCTYLQYSIYRSSLVQTAHAFRSQDTGFTTTLLFVQLKWILQEIGVLDPFDLQRVCANGSGTHFCLFAVDRTLLHDSSATSTSSNMNEWKHHIIICNIYIYIYGFWHFRCPLLFVAVARFMHVSLAFPLPKITGGWF